MDKLGLDCFYFVWRPMHHINSELQCSSSIRCMFLFWVQLFLRQMSSNSQLERVMQMHNNSTEVQARQTCQHAMCFKTALGYYFSLLPVTLLVFSNMCHFYARVSVNIKLLLGYGMECCGFSGMHLLVSQKRAQQDKVFKNVILQYSVNKFRWFENIHQGSINVYRNNHIFPIFILLVFPIQVSPFWVCTEQVV